MSKEKFKEKLDIEEQFEEHCNRYDDYDTGWDYDDDDYVSPEEQEWKDYQEDLIEEKQTSPQSSIKKTTIIGEIVNNIVDDIKKEIGL